MIQELRARFANEARVSGFQTTRNVAGRNKVDNALDGVDSYIGGPVLTAQGSRLRIDFRVDQLGNLIYLKRAAVFVPDTVTPRLNMRTRGEIGCEYPGCMRRHAQGCAIV